MICGFAGHDSPNGRGKPDRGIGLAGHPPPDIPIAEAAESGLRTLEHVEIVTGRLGEAVESERRRQFAKLWLINGGYNVAAFTTIGTVIGALS